MTLSDCISLIESDPIHFIATQERQSNKFRYKYPSYLASFGGSGNTLTRLIIEHITAIWTGSIYRDSLLLQFGLNGEGKCTQIDNIIAIKAHPEQQVQTKHVRNINMDCLNNRAAKKRYRRKHSYSLEEWNSNASAMFVVRDPWIASFAMYKLRQSLHGNKHIDNVPLPHWNLSIFQAHIQQQSTRWIKTFELMDTLDRNNFDFVVVKFENLFGENAVDEMDKMAKFLFSDKYYNDHIDELSLRMQCVAKQLIPANYGRFGKMHRAKANTFEHVTFEYAFDALMEFNTTAICEFWRNVEPFATRYGYTNLGDVDCELF